MLSSLWKDLSTISPGRAKRAVHITLICMIVVTISMTFQIPDPATSAYIVFFVAKEDVGRSNIASVVIVTAITVALGLVLALTPISLNYPSIRILVITIVSFVAFFLGASSKLAPVASVIGLLVAYALDLLQSAYLGEVATRGILYAELFTVFPIAVTLAYSLIFGSQPERLLREGLADRLHTAADVLGAQSTSAAKKLMRQIAGGNAELLAELKMTGLFHHLPPDSAARLKTLIVLTYRQLLTVHALRSARPATTFGARARQFRLVAREVQMGTMRSLSSEPLRQPATSSSILCGELDTSLLEINDVLSGKQLSSLRPSTLVQSATTKSAFFKPGAFTNPDHARFALKSAASVTICYLVFNLLDWPGIHTCMITCFIVCLSTVGESVQKMALRLGGCIIGAALGSAALVIVLPLTTSIVGLLFLIALVTFPAAWVAVGRPTVSYIGFQMAFAAFLCILQGAEPKFDLTIVRDRLFGILLGNVVVSIIFTQFFVIKLLPSLSRDLIAIVDGCRQIISALGAREQTSGIVDQVAKAQSSLQRVDDELLAYGYERRPSSDGRLHITCCRLVSRSLRRVLDEISMLAVYPPIDNDSEDARSFARSCGAIEKQLIDLTAALVDRSPFQTNLAPGEDEPSGRQDPDRSALVKHLQQRIRGLAIVFSRYRRTLDSNPAPGNA